MSSFSPGIPFCHRMLLSPQTSLGPPAYLSLILTRWRTSITDFLECPFTEICLLLASQLCLLGKRSPREEKRCQLLSQQELSLRPTLLLATLVDGTVTSARILLQLPPFSLPLCIPQQEDVCAGHGGTEQRSPSIEQRSIEAIKVWPLSPSSPMKTCI